MSEPLKNWAGNYEFSAHKLHFPETVEQVQDLVKSSDHFRVLGSRHSFNDIADSTHDLISLEHLRQDFVLDRERNRVSAAAATKYGHLAQFLFSEEYGLHNMASLPHISVAGTCATATHGSGDKNGNLATAVCGLELVTAAGELKVLTRDQHGEQFYGGVVSLGGLGVVTRVMLELSPTFDVAQSIYENLPAASLGNHFEEIMSSAYSVSLFTDWQHDTINQVWVKRRVDTADFSEPEPELFGATLARRDLHPIAELSAENCTKQRGVAGPWHERLPHFRMEFTPSSGAELQTEYFVPRRHATAALLGVGSLRQQLAPLLQISEIRSVAGDNLWMSPCYQQDCIAIHFTWKQNWPEVSKLLSQIEEQLAPFDARPHWGKLFTMEPERLRSIYAKLPDFQELLGQYDPAGKFRNKFLNTYIFGGR